jgi:hypothetical protein
MAEPFEILAAPFDIWLAPYGTAYPLVDDTPAVAWELLGTNGARNYDEAGITVTHEQTIETFRALRGTGPVKAFRTAEGLMLGFTLVDISLEQYARVLNDVTVTDVPAAGVNPGYRHMPLHQGPDVSVFALLARSSGTGGSPYGDNLYMQLEVPKVFQSANPTPVYRKGTPAGLAVVFTALEDLDAATDDERFGRLVAQDAVSPS